MTPRQLHPAGCVLPSSCPIVEARYSVSELDTTLGTGFQTEADAPKGVSLKRTGLLCDVKVELQRSVAVVANLSLHNRAASKYTT